MFKQMAGLACPVSTDQRRPARAGGADVSPAVMPLTARLMLRFRLANGFAVFKSCCASSGRCLSFKASALGQVVGSVHVAPRTFFNVQCRPKVSKECAT